MSIKMILEAINDVFQTDNKEYRAEFIEDYKNGKMKQGITLKPTDPEKCKAYPTVWLNGDEDKDYIYKIVKNLEESYLNNPYKDTLNIDKDFILSHVEKELVPNTYIEESKSKGYFYYSFYPTDMIVRYIVILEDSGLFRLSKRMIEDLNISDSELEESAVTNMKNHLEFKNMGTMLAEIMGLSDEESLFFTSDYPMYVLTNINKLYGAGQIVNVETLLRIQNMIHYDEFYILPSSKHEVIILPAFGNHSSAELRDMVHEVNITQVSENDYLSDQVLFVDEDCNISVA